MFGLSNHTLELITNCLRQFPEIAWGKIYGSRAKGDYQRGSDIDLAFSSSVDYSAELHELLDELPTPYLFDVTHYETLRHAELKAHIERVGVVFYQRRQQGVAMKAGWQIKRLGDVCKFDKRQGLHKNLPYVGLEHIESHTGQFIGSTDNVEVKSSTFKFTPEHVLYGRLRPYLNKVLAPDFTGHCSTEMFPLRPFPNLSREFLQYWLLSNSVAEKINATCTGARMPRANMNEVLNFDFLLPPLPEQQRIVGILDEAFEGIATAKANAEKNLQNAHALFESHLQAVFSRRGEGWVEQPLQCFAYSVSTGPFGSLLHKSDYVSDGVPLVNPINIVNGGIVPDSDKLIDDSTKQRLQSYVLQEGDIVVGRRGEIGRCAVVEAEQAGWVCGTGCFFIRPLKSVNSHFLANLIRSSSYREKLEQASSGATMLNLSNRALGELPVAIPNLAEQNHMLALLVNLKEETQRLETIYQQKLSVLDALKKSLLDQAFRGEL